MTQSLAKTWVHIVFSTKKRHPFFIKNSLQYKVHKYIIGICNNLGCSDVFIGGTDNHVHILLTLPKMLSLATLIQKIKSSSSKWIKSQSGFEHTLSNFQWQNGYGAFSVSHSNVPSIKEYIANQFEHHKKYTFENEIIRLFLKHDVAYDEQYLFD